MTDSVTVVSGLPRSGTSMMMRMLGQGGLELVTDTLRRADDDNPLGYFELEKVKGLKKDSAWLINCKGKAVKIISNLLYFMPMELNFKVIFLERDLVEVLTSQRKMLSRQGVESDGISDDILAVKFAAHLRHVKDWIKTKSNMECLTVHYASIMADPKINAKKVKDFLGRELSVDAMVSAVDSSLYRNRCR